MEELSMYQTATNIKPIDRLFLRMASLYGKHWIDLWAGVPMDAVKTEWQEKLDGMSSKVVFKAVDYCSENNKFPPTLPEFLQLCRASTPHKSQKALPRHFTDEELSRNKQRIKKAVVDITSKSQRDFKQWARDILNDENKGSNHSYLSIKLAQEALTANN